MRGRCCDGLQAPFQNGAACALQARGKGAPWGPGRAEMLAAAGADTSDDAFAGITRVSHGAPAQLPDGGAAGGGAALKVTRAPLQR
jgi:hypothetical protein